MDYDGLGLCSTCWALRSDQCSGASNIESVMLGSRSLFYARKLKGPIPCHILSYSCGVLLSSISWSEAKTSRAVRHCLYEVTQRWHCLWWELRVTLSSKGGGNGDWQVHGVTGMMDMSCLDGVPLELELSPDVGAGNWTRESNKCSYPLKHLSKL